MHIQGRLKSATDTNAMYTKEAITNLTRTWLFFKYDRDQINAGWCKHTPDH